MNCKKNEILTFLQFTAVRCTINPKLKITSGTRESGNLVLVPQLRLEIDSGLLQQSVVTVTKEKSTSEGKKGEVRGILQGWKNNGGRKFQCWQKTTLPLHTAVGEANLGFQSQKSESNSRMEKKGTSAPCTSQCDAATHRNRGCRTATVSFNSLFGYQPIS